VKKVRKIEKERWIEIAKRKQKEIKKAQNC